MPAKRSFQRLDAFSKTVTDAQVKTSAGGLVTIISLLVIFWLTWGEWADYRRIVVRPELVVDKGRGERMEIHLNITFPRASCQSLTLDVMDVSGEIQTGVEHGVHKVRLSPVSEGSREIEKSKLDLHSADDVAVHMSDSYCGGCYGARPPSIEEGAIKPGCCQTCDDVRNAYARESWSFGRGENVEQCEREHYAEKLDEQRTEGCRIEGDLRVQKVVGNFHIAPGRSFSNGNMHLHDLENFFNTPPGLPPSTMSHEIHSLRFGPVVPESFLKGLRTGPNWNNHDMNPLDGTKQETDQPAYNFMYFVKIVSTSYLPLGSKGIKDSGHSDISPLGQHGVNSDGSLETHQYSVTSHKRSLTGGNDAAEGHKERVHARGGIPGCFVSWDLNSLRVINREERAKSLLEVFTGLFAIIGGVLTVATAVDQIVFAGSSTLKKMNTR